MIDNDLVTISSTVPIDGSSNIRRRDGDDRLHRIDGNIHGEYKQREVWKHCRSPQFSLQNGSPIPNRVRNSDEID